MPLFADVAPEYERYLYKTSDILKEILIEKQYILTGEAFQKSIRFVACSILRSRMGYVLERDDPDMLAETGMMRRATACKKSLRVLYVPWILVLAGRSAIVLPRRKR